VEEPGRPAHGLRPAADTQPKITYSGPKPVAGAAPVHLLAVMDHTSRGILGQARVDGTTNEITRFRLLLDRLDLAATVVTADALHAQREHADWLVSQEPLPGPWPACATSPSASCMPTATATSPPRCAATPATLPESCIAWHHQPMNQTLRRVGEALDVDVGVSSRPWRQRRARTSRRRAQVLQAGHLPRGCVSAGQNDSRDPVGGTVREGDRAPGQWHPNSAPADPRDGQSQDARQPACASCRVWRLQDHVVQGPRIDRESRAPEASAPLLHRDAVVDQERRPGGTLGEERKRPGNGRAVGLLDGAGLRVLDPDISCPKLRHVRRDIGDQDRECQPTTTGAQRGVDRGPRGPKPARATPTSWTVISSM
jgi:predicted transposase YbfD/YdcC